MKFTNRDGRLRLYDGTGTPYYLEIIFDSGDFSGPIGIPKTEELIFLDRGRMSSNASYYEGADDIIMEPFDITFSVHVEDTATITDYLLDWLEGSTVNSNTIATTKQDTQRHASVNTPAFADSGKKTYNVEYFLDGSSDICWHYNEVYFPMEQQSFAESEDGVILSLTGKCYGTITRDTAFTSGTDVKA